MNKIYSKNKQKQWFTTLLVTTFIVISSRLNKFKK